MLKFITINFFGSAHKVVFDTKETNITIDTHVFDTIDKNMLSRDSF